VITLHTLQAAIDEAERFCRAARCLEASFIEAEMAVENPANRHTPILNFPVQSGAVRRSSMDLSRKLSTLRAPRSRVCT